MPAFVCRWPNGDFSVVQAPSKEEATIMLDEVGNADRYPLYAVPKLMLHFKLTNEGKLELEDAGESCSEAFWKKTYPILFSAMSKESNESEEEQRVELAEAAAQERERVPYIRHKDGADIPKAMKKNIEQRIGKKIKDSEGR